MGDLNQQVTRLQPQQPVQQPVQKPAMPIPGKEPNISSQPAPQPQTLVAQTVPTTTAPAQQLKPPQTTQQVPGKEPRFTGKGNNAQNLIGLLQGLQNQNRRGMGGK